MSHRPESLFLVAGSGRYPLLVAHSARREGLKRLVVAAFEGETAGEIEECADAVHWMRVGQIGRFLEAARASQASHAILAGQIAPKNLFDLRPDLRALVLLAKLKRRNAETLFGAVAEQLAAVGVEVLPATTFLEDSLAAEGHLAGPRLKSREIEDLRYGFGIAKETSRLDIGQSVVVKNGTVLAVEAFEGTNETITRGGGLGRGGALLVKVSKPGQDMRFDVPVIGQATLAVASEAGLRAIGVESGCTLLLDRDELFRDANDRKIALYGLKA